ncbi:MAG: WHG domain-containing protein [Polaromonas sp.]|nr:WHG domain-containing protein [Polaromonas sp.]
MARASVRAIGTRYLRFAMQETGLFRTAFGPSDKLIQATSELPTAGRSGLNPIELLGTALDELVADGVMPHEHRPGAEFPAWSAVHGLAMLQPAQLELNGAALPPFPLRYPAPVFGPIESQPLQHNLI